MNTNQLHINYDEQAITLALNAKQLLLENRLKGKNIGSVQHPPNDWVKKMAVTISFGSRGAGD